MNDADALRAELLARGAGAQSEPVSRPWGLREFRVLDPEGNQITFGQPFESSPRNAGGGAEQRGDPFRFLC